LIRFFFKKIYILIVFIGLAVIINDCAGPFFSKRPLPEIRPEDLIRKIQTHIARLNTLQGNAKISVNSEMGNFYGTLQVKARLPDSLYAKVEGPFGVDLALMHIHAEDLLFYSPYLHMAYTGSLNDSLSGLMPFDINTSDFLVQTLGLMTVPSYRMQEVDLLYSRERQYIMHFKNGERVWVHPKGPVITRWEKFDRQKHLVWTWEGRQFKTFGGVRLPQTIQINIENPKQKVTVFYKKRYANRHLKSGWSQFIVPEGVKPIVL